jgi:hypothetical protein
MAARRRKGGKRGRKFDPNARRHRTDRAGRRGEVDLGAPRLRQRKLLILGRADLELTPASTLFALGHLNNLQFSKVGAVTMLLHRIARACGKHYSVSGLWAAIIACGSRPTSFLPPVIGDANARSALSRICHKLNGSRSLILQLAEEREIPGIVVRAIGRRLTERDALELERLRADLDDLHTPRWATEDDAEPRRLHPFGGSPTSP